MGNLGEASARPVGNLCECSGRLSERSGDLSERLRRWGRGDPLGLPLTCWKGGHGWQVGVATAQGEMGSGQGEYWPV